MEVFEKEKTFIARTISTLILFLFIFYTIFFMPPSMYYLVVILFASLSLWEFYKILEKKYGKIYPGIGLASSWILFLSSLDKSPELKNFIYFLSFSLIILFLYQFTKKDNHNASVSLGLTLLGLIYISLPFLFFIKLRYLNSGACFVAYYIVVSKAADIGAYLVGMKYGKHLLIPRISPKKSLEGFIGGIVSSWIIAYIGALYIPGLSLRHVPAIGLILGIFAQFGDLAESIFKRDAGIKDSGSTIPGLGGVLDLVDSLLLSLPFYYLYIHIFVSP